MSLLQFLLKSEPVPQAPENSVVKVKLCSIENFDDDSSDLTPIRKSRKKEIHKNHEYVQKCRDLKVEGFNLVQISMLSGIEISSLEKWEKKGWLDAQIKRRKNSKYNEEIICKDF